ncbi:Holliday junction resolvasome RuvABC endonuclease subunit [Streptococcus rupicaprae]|uniref:Holliday junction resolvasome RuvABC endonuclease subunit n=1 Tax=Streptococcus rupicaprae TaxID=759619 RepID=A0ABV2FJH0_9STRE
MSLTLSLDVSTTGTGWAVFDGSILIQSGVSKPKQKSFYERAKAMASELKVIQLRTIQERNKPFEDIVIEQNTVMGPNQQSSIKIGIATGIILGRLLSEEVYFVNVSTWRKYWKFSYKDRSKKSMKRQAVNTVSMEFDKQVKDDEADAILIGSYFVNLGKEFGDLESHRN